MGRRRRYWMPIATRRQLREQRERLRAQGLWPIQIWVPGGIQARASSWRTR